MYFGTETRYPHSQNLQLSMTEMVVAELAFALREGHHIYTDRYYTSLSLMQFLKTKNHYLTGTININRKGLPQEIKALQLNQFEAKFFENGKGESVCAWRDKKAKTNVVMVSSFHRNEMETLRRKRETVSIPTIVADYNRKMGGVDRFDQLLGYYSVVRRKTIKWWKKVLFWLLEAMLVNSYIAFNDLHPQERQISLVDFKRKVVQQLVPESSPSSVEESLQGVSHFGSRTSTDIQSRFRNVPHLVDEDGQSRDCRVCSDRKSKNRRETRFFCTGCDDRPHLHPKNCFLRYHTVMDYKNT